VKAGVDRSFRNAVDVADAQRPEGVLPPSLQRGSPRLALVPRLLILGVCGWSLIETPAEYDPSAGDLGIAALALAKIAWIVIGVAAARGMKRAQWIFSFLCGLSLVAIVPGLPIELNESAWIFYAIARRVCAQGGCSARIGAVARHAPSGDRCCVMA
jgi:hypothetical protein